MADFQTTMKVVADVKKTVANLQKIVKGLNEIVQANVQLAKSSQNIENTFNFHMKKASERSYELADALSEIIKNSQQQTREFAMMRQSVDYLAMAFGEFVDESKDDEKEQTMTLARMAMAFTALGAAAGASFAYMASWSPSLAAALSLIRLDLGLLAMRLGEDLAPIIRDVALPAVREFTDFVENDLPDPLRQWLLLTTYLTLAVAGLTFAVNGLKVALGVKSVKALLRFLGIIGIIIGFVAAFDIQLRRTRDQAGEVSEAITKIRMALSALGFIIGAVGLIILAVGGGVVGFVFLAIGTIILLISAAADEIAAFFGWFQNETDKVATQIDVETTMEEGTVPGRQQEEAPPFHSGGIFAGDRPGLALLKPRERVLTPTEQRSLGLLGGGNAGQSASSAVVNNNYYVTISGGKFTSAAERRREAEMFAREVEKQNNTRGFI